VIIDALRQKLLLGKLFAITRYIRTVNAVAPGVAQQLERLQQILKYYSY
jgi:hypothetical protein